LSQFWVRAQSDSWEFSGILSGRTHSDRPAAFCVYQVGPRDVAFLGVWGFGARILHHRVKDGVGFLLELACILQQWLEAKICLFFPGMAGIFAASPWEKVIVFKGRTALGFTLFFFWGGRA